MKKEIKVWVEGMYVEGNQLIYGNYHKIWTEKYRGKGSLEATLIIDAPEPKVEITPSKVDKLIDDAWIYDNRDEFTKYIKEKLFGEQE